MASTWRNRRIVALTVIALLVLATAALADDVVNTLTRAPGNAVEEMALAVGDDDTTSFWVDEKNGDGRNGCNFVGGGSLTISISSSNGAVATVEPSDMTFTACGAENAQVVTVTGVAPGTARITATVVTNTTTRNVGSSTSPAGFDTGPATFDVVVSAAEVDACAGRTAPTEVPTVTLVNTPDATTGWFNAATGGPRFTLTPSENVEYQIDNGVWQPYEGETLLTKEGAQIKIGTRAYLPVSGDCPRLDGPEMANPDRPRWKVDLTAPDPVDLVDVTVDDSVDPAAISFSPAALLDATVFLAAPYGGVPEEPTCLALDNITDPEEMWCNVAGYGDTPGSHTLTATAVDEAGNVTVVSHSYDVVGLANVNANFAGTGIVRARMGQTIPLKWTVTDGTDDPVVLDGVELRMWSVPCLDSSGVWGAPEASAGASGLQLLEDGSHQFNWQTPRRMTTGCKAIRVEMTLPDGRSVIHSLQAIFTR